MKFMKQNVPTSTMYILINVRYKKWNEWLQYNLNYEIMIKVDARWN